MSKGQIEKKVQYGGKKSSVGWKRIPNTNEEGTNRKKKVQYGRDKLKKKPV